MMLLDCPNCGPRSVSEFRYGGEARPRPQTEADPEVWTKYVYYRRNPSSHLTEWWYHRAGCRRWFLAERHTETHEVRATYFWVEPKEAEVA